ncbi:tyrosine-protein phosphatase non-receptor type 2 [Eurytemora carolleeae]|uniref:tyrosine-protein phosphatase non-receptor type 2 n=1 Tax=Eurytemora carolleeae TaxID=1294199 RepID=UPI000C78132D|nr:tyrosine-protein phosphatase non-receptor type 2 [Eurytemora carolleeae]|eukprot:XP_023345281.1 tyrosine-protein phosphatase non-receptor type 2-like [Eurytemora affinis]
MEEEFREIQNMWRHHYSTICIESRNIDHPALEALKPENKSLNRYRDVYPYDHSRVPLKSVAKTDYINASLVEVPEVKRKYILTQGPLGNTVDHFWSMVWEQNSKAVIMLNRVIEKGTLKCHPYWPQNTGDRLECEESGLVVTNDSCIPGEHYNLTSLILTHSNLEESRTVLHYQYTTWPDFGVPTSPDTFLEFLGAVRDSGSLEQDVGPAIVHCSAGIGRSGSFILVDSCLLRAETEGPDSVNIKQTLLNMRTYRMGLIQTEDQLKFTYLSIIEGARQSGLISSQLDLSDPGSELISSSSSDDEAPPPLPPPRSESLQEKGVEKKIDDPFSSIPATLESLVNGDAEFVYSVVNGVVSLDSEPSSDPSSPSTPAAMDSPAKCILNNNKLEERKREMELRRRKKEDERANTEEKLRKIQEKMKESEAWVSRKQNMKETILPFCVGLAMFLAGGYYYFRS